MKSKVRKKTIHIVRLNSFIKRNGKVVTALALGLKETNAINNWISRNHVPDMHKESILGLKKQESILVKFK